MEIAKGPKLTLALWVSSFFIAQAAFASILLFIDNDANDWKPTQYGILALSNLLLLIGSIIVVFCYAKHGSGFFPAVYPFLALASVVAITTVTFLAVERRYYLENAGLSFIQYVLIFVLLMPMILLHRSWRSKKF